MRFALARSSSISSVVRRLPVSPSAFCTSWKKWSGRDFAAVIHVPSHPVRGVNLSIHCERGDDNLNDSRSIGRFAPSRLCLLVHG